MLNRQLFSQNPFYLNDSQICRIFDIFNTLSVKDKVGQLFFLVGYNRDQAFVKRLTHDLKIGGFMSRSMDLENVSGLVTDLQSNTKIPLLIAANLESGGNGICKEGTKVGSCMAISATKDVSLAKKLGEICAVEGKAVGANLAFAPVCDIDLNFRNPITNTRTFGGEANTVLEFCRAYVDGCQSNGMAVSIKHFPGDGVDERDQHLLTSVNTMSVDEWEKTFGNIYKTLIEDGAKTVMAGHIMLPQYSKLLNPELTDQQVLPASLSKELLLDLLRKKMGFNGVIISDATTMAGFNIPMERNKAVPYCIEAGCDMFLFTRNLDEDYQFMLDGVENGTLSQTRLDDAVLRILGLKMSLGLFDRNNIPDKKLHRVVNCDQHKTVAFEVADKSITLVKCQEDVLPISVEKHKRILLYSIESGENTIGYARETGIGEKFGQILSSMGFLVSHFKPKEGYEGLQTPFKEVVENFDLIIYVCNLATKSNQTTVRIEWENPMGANAPFYLNKISTIFISTENPYHLLDVPRVKTYINTYGINEFTLKLLAEKLMGKSEFKGKSPIDPFVGKWDTRL